MEAVLALCARAEPHCALLELRLDAAAPGVLDPAELVRRAPRPVLFTCRPPREGGRWRGSEEARLDLLARAARSGAAWVDVEWDAVDPFLARGPVPTRLLVSRHDVSGALSWDELFASVRRPEASAGKVAARVGDAREALELLARAEAEPRPTVAVALGFAGAVSRLVGPCYGAPHVYAAADPERPAAPGQLGCERLAGLLWGRRLGPQTRLYAVVGRPLAHSRSPDVHNEAFAALGVDAVYAWLETAAPEALLEALDARWRGLSVTSPHKETLLRAAGVRPEEEAAAVGAVNTLVRAPDGGWRGRNTDALAARRLLAAVAARRSAAAERLRLGLLGCGGAARAVAWAARSLGMSVRVYARNAGRARRLAEDFGAAYAGGHDALGAEHGCDVLCNATPVGMSPGPALSPVAAEAFGAGVVAYDLVYAPRRTRFLADAAARGAEVVDGVEHFVLQARAQLELWLGRARLGALPAGWPAALATAPASRSPLEATERADAL
ncbi:MAG: type I 3-dehydroquinate dehydratase [Planctomycetota bacterium]|nr:MAG: type I 3-dehydroquinate dehydratase [Planctomycetota bacterium]